jgi:sorting nexin-8
MHVSSSDFTQLLKSHSQELAVWRKQATISVQEEFVGRSLPPTLEDSLPRNLQDTFDTARNGVRRSADLYINLCNVVERLCKRKEALAGEYGRLNLNLVTLTEVTADTYAIDTSDVSQLDNGIRGTAKHIDTSQSLLNDEARAWDEGVLEDVKTMRDALVSVRDMFDRRDRLAKDNIPQLEKKILANENKLQGIRAKGDMAKPGEADKVVAAITAVSLHDPITSSICSLADNDDLNRTNNPLSLSTRAASSSRSVCEMSCYTSRALSTA